MGKKLTSIYDSIRHLALASVICALSSTPLYGKGLIMENNIRLPHVAGQFYPSDPVELRRLISSLLEDADVSMDPRPEIVSLVAPHAGYVYSGRTAAKAYSLLQKGQFNTVVVISPCHVDFFPFSSIYSGDAYRTPLGDIPVDRTLADLLASSSDHVRTSDRGHVAGRNGRGEHSLEVQLPFLQVALGDFSLVPIVMGDQSPAVIKALSDALSASLFGKDVLIVASTDLSHFHTRDEARTLDKRFTDCLDDFDPDGIVEALSSGRTEACGGGPAAATLAASRSLGADDCMVLEYTTSGDVSGDHSSVVGYVSALAVKTGISGKEVSGSATARPDTPITDDAGLTADDRSFLLLYARNVLEAAFEDREPDMDIPGSVILGEKRGGFVTLKRDGQLRGCIGYIEAVMPLSDTIKEMAKAAAFNDSRFPSLQGNELEAITIEISVLSPVREIADPSEVEVGRHGIIISTGGRRGLLLPQVATEWGWDRDTFLSQTCVKAGLDPGAWKRKGTKIEIFSAVVFSE